MTIVTFGELRSGQRFIAAPGPGRVYSADAPAFIFLKLPAAPCALHNGINITTGAFGTWHDHESVIPVAP